MVFSEVLDRLEKFIKDKSSAPAPETKECEKWCGMNYCDENGCMNRKRHLTEPVEPAPLEGKGVAATPVVSEEEIEKMAEDAFDSCFDFAEIKIKDYSEKEMKHDIIEVAKEAISLFKASQ